MKSFYKLILGLVVFLLCALVWWLKRPALSPPVPVQAKSTLRSEPAGVAPANPSQAQAEVTARSEANAAPVGDAASKRQFSEMDVLDRGVIMKEIGKKSLSAIFQHFLDAGRLEGDSMKQSGLSGMLAEEIRDREPDLVFLKRLQEIIESETPSKLERGAMLDVLSSAATIEATELLLHEAATLKDNNLRGTAINCLAVLGDHTRSKRAGAVTQALGRAWKATNDPGVMAATARSMASIGSADGVELLVAAVLAPDGQDDERRFSAYYALRKVYSSDAVPPLVAILEKNPVGSRANTLAFNTLSQLGQEAAQAQLKWLRNTDSSAAPLAKQWVAHASGSSVEAAQAALDPAVTFHSEENRKAIREGLEAYRAGREGKNIGEKSGPK